MSVPVVIRGKDSTGKSFIEKTQTVVINRRGAKLQTCHSVPLGTCVLIAVPHLKRVSSAKVAWSGAAKDERQEIGIDLGEPSDFWGVQFPEGSVELSLTLNVAEQSDGPDPATAGGHASEASLPISFSDIAGPCPAETIPEESMEKSDKLSTALQELTHAVLEKSLSDTLPRLSRSTEAKLNEMQSLFLEQTRERLRRVVEDVLQQFEQQVSQAAVRNQEHLEKSFQGVVKTAEERLRASVAECEERLTARAGTVRQELANTLATLSGALSQR